MPLKQKTRKQTGGWFWQETDPYTGGIVKAIKHYAKPHHVVDLAGYAGMPYASPMSTGLKMVGLGHRRHQRGRGILTPNSSDFGGVKF
jgi:hypothetical protein